jgi:chromosome segregation ATPase
MAGTTILEDIEKKSREIMRSNEELASRLKKNQDLIAKFSDELEGLKSESGDSFDFSVKKELEKLKTDLESKRTLITELIDDMKPIEVDIARREDLIDSMQNRVDDQAKKIEMLSKDLMDNKKQLEQYIAQNTELRKQAAEKDGLIKVMKDKLGEKVSLLKDVDGKNRDMEQDIESGKKQLFALNNRIIVMEKRLFAGDEQNQKLLYELLKHKESLKVVDAEAAEKERLLQDIQEEHAKELDELKKAEEEKRIMVVRDHARKMTAMNATISALKSKIDQQNRILEEKMRKEEALIGEFNTRMRDLLSSKSVPIDTSSIPSYSTSIDTESYSAPVEEQRSQEPMFVVEAETSLRLPSKMDEIIPMVELAMDHGDDLDKIRHSLASSGYSDADISKAFSKLNLGN